MPLDPAARLFLDQLEATGAPPLERMTPADARLMVDALFTMQGDGPPLARVEDRTVPGPAGPITVRIYTPEDALPLPGLVHLHGGGWVVGSLAAYDATCRLLAARTPAVVVGVDYRLAPEHRFPAAVEDVFAATQWVAAHADALGIAPGRLAVGGDSAGGNLSAVVALLARDRGGPPLALQALVYPATDARCDTPSYRENREGYFLTRAGMDWFWGHYLRDPADRDEPRVSPLRARDLGGLPPALVQIAEYDPLRDEGDAYAARLRAAGVPVTLTRYPGMIHSFVGLRAVFPQAMRALDEIAAALRTARV